MLSLDIGSLARDATSGISASAIGAIGATSALSVLSAIGAIGAIGSTARIVAMLTYSCLQSSTQQAINCNLWQGALKAQMQDSELAKRQEIEERARVAGRPIVLNSELRTLNSALRTLNSEF